MIHNGHCFHCGQVMAAGSQECGNELCRIDERARPIWPWSRCAGDETVALLCTPIWPWLLLPISGILLLLFGTAVTSGRLIDIGLIIVSGWCLSRYLLSLIRNTHTTLFIHEQSRRQAQEKHNLGMPHTDTPDLRKKLDDEYDRVEHDQWAVRGFRWLKLTVNLATALLVMLFILSWGPGDILHWDNIKNWGHGKIKKITNSRVVADAKRELNWDNNRLKYLENVLRGERGLAFWQFDNIVNYQHFSVDTVFDILKNTELQNDELYQYIYQEMQLAAAKLPSLKAKETRGFAQKAQERFHVLRETYWQILFWINTLLFLFVAGSLIMMPLSFAIAKGIMFGDEIKDIVIQKIEEYEEKRKEKTDVKATPAVAKVIKEAVSSEGGKHGIISIGAISLITDLIFDKLLRKFFQ